MRSFLFAALLSLTSLAADPGSSVETIRPLLEETIKTFRTEGPKGWSFTQTTRGEGRSRIERYDARQPEFDRWTLLQQDDRAPTEEEARDYREKLSRRSRGGTAPRLGDQLDLTTLQLTNETIDRVTCRARLKPGESGDATAKFLIATIVLHKPTRTIESFELAAESPFAPTLGVKITSMRTTLTYSLPEDDRPSLLQSSVTHLRGRAFFFKSLDADMTVTYTDYERAFRR